MNAAAIRRLVDRHRLTFAIIGVIAIALVMTAISMSLYITSGTSSLDLSRPGYSQVRDQVNAASGVSFSENGPMNAEVLDNFTKILESQQKAIDALDGFNDPVLDDQALQLQ